MLKMPDTKAKFFSVKNSTKIQGAHYIPSVCYPLTQGLQAVVEEMAAQDMARIYPEKVRFVTGVPYPVKKPEPKAAPVLPSSVPTPAAKTSGSEKPSRRSGKNAFTSQQRREFE